MEMKDKRETGPNKPFFKVAWRILHLLDVANEIGILD